MIFYKIFKMDINQAKEFYISKFETISERKIFPSQEEINRYSQLICRNPLYLEFYDDLLQLMIKFSDGSTQSKIWAHNISVACCGKTHLYLDMGFIQRSEVTNIFCEHFPLLAAKNINNAMRWKKFLYRQFCIDSNLPICPSASCSDCPSYNECYIKV